MHITIKAKFQDGVLVPLEALELLNLNEGDEVFVSIRPEPKMSYDEMVAKSQAASWVGLVDAEALKRNIYRDRHRGLDCDCIYCVPTEDELPG